MELEDLKNRWEILEEQLKKQEIVNEKLIREIRQTKSGPLATLITYGYLGIALCVLAMFILIYGYIHSYFLAFKTFLLILGGIVLLTGIVLGIYNILHLKKIDFTASVSQNIRLVQTYIINYKKQSVFTYTSAGIFIILFIIACLLSPDMEAWRWVLIWAIIPLGVILGIWEYKVMYKAKTNAILKSLEELRELEEEPE